MPSERNARLNGWPPCWPVPALDPWPLAGSRPEMLGARGTQRVELEGPAVRGGRPERGGEAVEVEGEQERRGRLGQPHDLTALRVGRLLRTGLRVERGERLGDLCAFACPRLLPGLRLALGGDVPLDGHVSGDRAVAVVDRRDGRLLGEERAVTSPVDEVAHPGAPVGDRRPQGLVEGVALDAALQHPRVVAHGVGGRVPRHALERGVHVLDVAADVGDHDRFGRLLDRHGQPPSLALGERPGGARAQGADAVREVGGELFEERDLLGPNASGSAE